MRNVNQINNEEVRLAIKIPPWAVVKKNGIRIIRTNLSITSDALFLSDCGFIFKHHRDENEIQLNNIDEIKYYLGKARSLSGPQITIFTKDGNLFNLIFSNRNKYNKQMTLIIEELTKVFSGRIVQSGMK